MSTPPFPAVALAGNPNTGKTALFNAFTGMRQTVGNWPGVTVEKRTGIYSYDGREFELTDLPGAYSLRPYSDDEAVTRDYLLGQGADVVVNVVDAANPERNLVFTVELRELGLPLVVAFNRYDLGAQDYLFDFDKMSSLLGVHVIPTIALEREGLEELKALAAARVSKPCPPLVIDYGPELEPHLAALCALLEKIPGLPPTLPCRWLALQLLADDPHAAELVADLPGGDAVISSVQQVTRHLKSVAGVEAAILIAERRRGFVAGLARDAIRIKVTGSYRATRSDRIDQVITHPFYGLPIFIVSALAAFQAAFYLAKPLTALLQRGQDEIAGIITNATAPWPPLLTSLLVDGALGGVGTVLSFFPNIFMLFLVIAILEDSGYMARAAFVMDRLMHALGLHGRSFIPLILGFGCNVPAVLATRTLERKRDRWLTIAAIPYISCSARLPVYTLFAAVFFPRHGGLVIMGLYLFGIIIAAAVMKITGQTILRGESPHFVMELPPYRIPTLRGVFQHAAERSWEFVTRAAGIILAASIVLWALANLPPGTPYAASTSWLGRIGTALAPAFTLAGFNDWSSAVALVTGVVAKEAVVSTLGVVYGAEGTDLAVVLTRHFTPLSAATFLIMTLVYVPCVATIAAVYRETRSWLWTAFTVILSILLGWTLAVIVFQGGRLLGWG